MPLHNRVSRYGTGRDGIWLCIIRATNYSTKSSDFPVDVNYRVLGESEQNLDLQCSTLFNGKSCSADSAESGMYDNLSANCIHDNLLQWIREKISPLLRADIKDCCYTVQ